MVAQIKSAVPKKAAPSQTGRVCHRADGAGCRSGAWYRSPNCTAAQAFGFLRLAHHSGTTPTASRPAIFHTNLKMLKFTWMFFPLKYDIIKNKIRQRSPHRRGHRREFYVHQNPAEHIAAGRQPGRIALAAHHIGKVEGAEHRHRQLRAGGQAGGGLRLFQYGPFRQQGRLPADL